MLEQRIENFQKPTNSPDLTLIENLWGLMKREIEKEAPKSKVDLDASIRRVALQISRETQVQLMNSITQRFDDWINLDGEVIPNGLRSL